MRRFVLFELNEVPMRVVHHFAERHPRSAFAKILRKGVQWETITPDEGHLSPWITWPTLHRGVSGAHHGVLALGQDITDNDRKFPPIWSLLASAGRTVGLFGSLHSYPPPPDASRYAFYLPDTFANGPEAYPPGLSAFQSFNLHMVDGSGRNVSSKLPMKRALGFLLHTVPMGLRAATLAKVLWQVTSERIWSDRSARRRSIQSILAFDMFLAQLKRKLPDAAFFFSNHVASAMHRYWPATFPEDYQETQWEESWLRRFSGELDYAMAEADQMLWELMRFADHHPNYLILVSGSMGQAAVDSPDRQISTEVLVRDMRAFVERLGVGSGWHRRRTMEPTYTLAFDEPEGADLFMEKIQHLRIAGEPVPSRRLDDYAVEFVLGNSNIHDDELVATLGNTSLSPDDLGIRNIPIQDGVGAAAYHVPEGILLAYGASLHIGLKPTLEPIRTTQIAPTLLMVQGLKPAPYMEPPIRELVILTESRNDATALEIRNTDAPTMN